MLGMEIQEILVKKPNLEKEQENVIKLLVDLVDSLSLNKRPKVGKPRFLFSDIIKSIVVMSYSGLSYRRVESYLRELKEYGYITRVPKKSTLSKYMSLEETKEIVERLIKLTAIMFVDGEDCLIIDSTSFPKSPYRRAHKTKNEYRYQICKKLHAACLRKSKIISAAIISNGSSNDILFFQDLVTKTLEVGFQVKYVLADKAYCSRNNYVFCYEQGINEIYLDFKKSIGLKTLPRPFIWKQRLKEFRDNPERWKETYRFRVLIEGVFSSIKRKFISHMRNRNDTNQEVELLLKVLCYNLGVISKYI